MVSRPARLRMPGLYAPWQEFLSICSCVYNKVSSIKIWTKTGPPKLSSDCFAISRVFAAAGHLLLLAIHVQSRCLCGLDAVMRTRAGLDAHGDIHKQATLLHVSRHTPSQTGPELEIGWLLYSASIQLPAVQRESIPAT